MPTPPPPLRSPRMRVSAPVSVLFLLLTSAASAPIPYSSHCDSLVPSSPPTTPLSLPPSLRLSSAFLSGGAPLLSSPGPGPNSTFSFPRSFSFLPKSLSQTLSPSTLHLTAALSFRGGGFRRSLRFYVGPASPRTFLRSRRVAFDLSGYLSRSSGKLCMVGTGSARSSKYGTPLHLSAVFKLNLPPENSTIETSLAAGVVESLDDAGGLSYFERISVVAYAPRNYEYSMIRQAEAGCSAVKMEEEAVNFQGNAICGYVNQLSSRRFEMEYRGDWESGRLGFNHRFMSLNRIECSGDVRLHMYLGFSNQSGFGSSVALVPEKSLVAEGVWDKERNRLCLVACRVLNVSDYLSQGLVSDCTIGVSLWFPAVLSIERRSAIVGWIWSNRSEDDSEYFDMVSFRSLEDMRAPGLALRYNYTKMEVVKKSCVKSGRHNTGKRRYPDGKSLEDMRFDMSVRDAEGKSAWGNASPFAIGEQLYVYPIMGILEAMPHVPKSRELNGNVFNISYKISHSLHGALPLSLHEPVEISAEGIYDSRTGILCMVGCQQMGSKNFTNQAKYSMDCEIVINIQLAPLNPETGEYISGTIRSTREKLDPLYFEPLEISSFGMYKTQATESTRWMDIEIIMVLVSLTLSCIFIGLQLFHIKKHPDVLPSISITMLIMLMLGHMIPLVLNIEALFFNDRNRQNVLLWSGGWLEVNEIVLRVIKMVAFLLLFRLLQVAWSSKSAHESKYGLWAAEKKTLLTCLPLYLLGGLIAWFIHFRSNETQVRDRFFKAQMSQHFFHAHHHSLWEGLMSYAGLLLDGFLLPQFIHNIYSDSKEASLALSFYIGTTVVRALPHVYDAYRARHYVPRLRSSYIYASHNGDFYSATWDIIIPCGGVLFAVLIYFQQRFGGAFILRRRSKNPGGYEMVPIVGH